MNSLLQIRCGFRPVGLLLTLFVAGFVCVPSILGEPPASRPGVEEKFRALESARFAAVERGDTAALDAMFDNALVVVEPDGSQLTKAEYLAGLHAADSTVLQVKAESITVHAFGDIALTAGIYREKGVRDGRPYALRCRFINTWAFKRGKWVCVAATASGPL